MTGFVSEERSSPGTNWPLSLQSPLNLSEFLGVVFAVLGSVATAGAAWLLGYGVLGALLGLVAGFLGGFVLGAALTVPVVHLLDWLSRPGRKN